MSRVGVRPRGAAGLSVLAFVVAAAPALAAARAQIPRVAWVDEVAIFGGPDEGAGRAFVGAVLREAGLSPTFAPAHAEPCGEDTECLAGRARAAGAVIAVRATVVDVAGSASVALVAVDGAGGRWVVRKHGVDLSAGDPEIAAALAASPLLAQAEPADRRLAWSLTGGSALLFAGGALALWHAYDLRSDFFARHIDDDGHVVGISPADAKAREVHARRWSVAGSVLLAAGAGAGLTAGILFAQGSPESPPHPSGLVLAGEF